MSDALLLSLGLLPETLIPQRFSRWRNGTVVLLLARIVDFILVAARQSEVDLLISAVDSKF